MLIALVTGAGSGIGQAAAEALAAEGWTLVLTGRRMSALEAVASRLPGDAHLCHAADVGIAGEVETLFDAIAQRFGRLDFAFVNAGTNVAAAEPDALSPEDWQSVVNVNLTGAFLSARGAYALMKRQEPKGGRILFNGSISAHVPRPQSAAYAATKHGVTGLTRSFSLDGRRHGICVGQIDIGNAATDMTERMADGVLQPDGELRPEARMDVAAVGRAVAYLASLPPEVNVPFMTIMANGMPFMGRG